MHCARHGRAITRIETFYVLKFAGRDQTSTILRNVRTRPAEQSRRSIKNVWQEEMKFIQVGSQ